MIFISPLSFRIHASNHDESCLLSTRLLMEALAIEVKFYFLNCLLFLLLVRCYLNLTSDSLVLWDEVLRVVLRDISYALTTLSQVLL